MKIHEMKLFEKPFEKIKNNQKDIEVRLFDEKRKQIRVRDKIIFKKLPDLKEEIAVEVVGLSIFPSFKELFFNFPKDRFGHQNITPLEQISKIYDIYDKEEEEENGVVGIHIKLI